MRKTVDKFNEYKARARALTGSSSAPRVLASNSSASPLVLNPRHREVNEAQMLKWLTNNNETAPDDNSPPEYKHNLHDLAPFLEAENHLVELLQSFRSYLQEHHPVESAVLGPDGRPTALNLPRDLPTVAVQVKVGDVHAFSAQQKDRRELRFVDQHFKGNPVIIALGPGHWHNDAEVGDCASIVKKVRAVYSRPPIPEPSSFITVVHPQVSGEEDVPPPYAASQDAQQSSGPQPFKVSWTFCEYFSHKVELSYTTETPPEHPPREQQGDSAAVWFVRKLDREDRPVEHRGKPVGIIVIFTDNIANRGVPAAQLAREPWIARGVEEPIRRFLRLRDAYSRDPGHVQWRISASGGMTIPEITVKHARVMHARKIGDRMTLDYNLPYAPTTVELHVFFRLPALIDGGRSNPVTATFQRRTATTSTWLMDFEGGLPRDFGMTGRSFLLHFE